MVLCLFLIISEVTANPTFEFHSREVDIHRFFSVYFPSSTFFKSSKSTCHLFNRFQNTNSMTTYNAPLKWFLFINDDAQIKKKSDPKKFAISIFGNSESAIRTFSLLSMNGFSPTFEVSNNSKYILSHIFIDNLNGFSQIPLETSDIDGVIPKTVILFSIGQCTRILDNVLNINRAIVFYLVSFFFILAIFRIYYLFLSTNIKDQFGSCFWFSTKRGSFLTFPGNRSAALHRVYTSMILKLSDENPTYSTITKVERFSNTIRVSHLTLHLMNKDIIFATFWAEDFIESCHFKDQIIEGGQVLVDDSDIPNEVLMNLEFTDQNYPLLRIPFKIDDQICTLTVTSHVTDSLPFGLYSLHSAYLDYLHVTLFYEALHLRPSYSSVIDYLKSIQGVLDFAAFGIFKIRHGLTMPYFLNDTTGHLKDKIFKFIKKLKPKNLSIKNIQRETVDNFRFGANRFMVGSQEYIVFASIWADRFLIRSSEMRIHFLISMIVAFHNSILSKNDEMNAFERTLSLFAKTGKFSFIETVETPLNFTRSRGTLFGREVNQRCVDTFSSATIIPDTNVHKFMDLTRMLHVCIPYQIAPNDYKFLSVTSEYFYDRTHDSNCYNYIVEDATDLMPKSIEKMVTALTLLAESTLLCMHKVNEKLDIIPPDHISSELGYDGLLNNIESIILPCDLPLLKRSLRTMIRLRGANGILRRYFAFMPSFENVIILFSADITKSLPSFPVQNEHLTGEFCILVIDLEMGNAISHITPNLLMRSASVTKDDGIQIEALLQPLECDIDEEAIDLLNIIVNSIHRDDLEIFLSMLKVVRRKKQGIVSNFVRLLTVHDYQWHIVVVTEREGETLSLFLANLDEMLRASLRTSDTLQIYESSFCYLKILQFTFENAQQPLRVFSSMPISSNVVTINWATLNHNVLEADQEKAIRCFSQALENDDGDDREHFFSVLLRCKFETERLVIFRGRRKLPISDDSHEATAADDICGIMIDVTSFFEATATQEKKAAALQQSLAVAQEARELTRRVIGDFRRVLEALECLVQGQAAAAKKKPDLTNINELYHLVNQYY